MLKKHPQVKVEYDVHIQFEVDYLEEHPQQE